MNNIDANYPRSQVSQAQLRQSVKAADRFQSLLKAAPDSDFDQESGTNDGGERGNDAFGGLPHESSAEDVQPLPKGVINLFWESLQQEFSETRDVAGFLNALLRDVTRDLQASRHLQDDPWRLLVRLRPDFLLATALEISCKGRHISIILRTANEDSYRSISDALPRLNTVLAAKNFCTDEAKLYLVGLEDLS